MSNAAAVSGQNKNDSLQLSNGLTNRVNADKETFLKLLITQLRHQDPLNPTEDKEFIAQLAQFSTLESLNNIRTDVQGIGAAQNKQQVVNAVNLIGKEISAEGDVITKLSDGENTYVGVLYATLPTAVKSVTFKVYATNEDGSIGRMVFSETHGAYGPGTLPPYKWSGKDSHGKELDSGTYIVNVSAVKENGESVVIKTESQGIVYSVKTAADGNHELFLEDGRSVFFNNITYVQAPQKQSAPKEEKKDGDTTTDAASGKEGSSKANASGKEGSSKANASGKDGKK